MKAKGPSGDALTKWLYDIEHNNPDELAKRAKLCRHSAAILWANREKGIEQAVATTDSPAYALHTEAWRIAAYLDALAVELIAKSIIARRGGDSVAGSHLISKMVEEIDPALAAEFTAILHPLDQTSIWAGRYPTPKDPKHFLRTKIDPYSGSEYEPPGGFKPSELKQVLKLYDRLCAIS